jgi:uncharacterized protein DUF5343
MSLPDSYTLKPGAIPAYFNAIQNADAPPRFSQKFLEGLGFTSTNDRLLIGVLKDLRFIDADGVPQKRYYEFLDSSRSAQVMAEAIREAFSDLFSVNRQAHKLSPTEVRNKLRTLYAGKKKDSVIALIARTFVALCQEADFEAAPVLAAEQSKESRDSEPLAETTIEQGLPIQPLSALPLDSLQYHINIVLPESRDQGVYDAIFKSLRQHLG